MTRSWTLFVLGIILTLPGAARAQQTAREDSSALVPRWRLQANPFSSSSGVSLGLYRRIGPRSDLGINLTASLSHQQTTGSETDTVSENPKLTGTPGSDGHRSSLGCTLELRRWRPLYNRMAWFWGPQGTLGYTRASTSNSDGTHSDSSGYLVNDTELTKGWQAGLYLIAGADLTLLRGLTLTGVVRPIGASYTWESVRSSSVDTDFPPRIDSHVTDSKTHSTALSTSFASSFYLTLRI